MESNMALTTPSTSLCVRSGKSVQSFCTSSERIIENPVKGGTGPPPPALGTARAARCQETMSHARRILRAAPQEETPPAKRLLFLRLFRFLGFLQGSATDVAQRRARVRRAILRDGLLLLGDLHRLDREVRLLRAVEADDHCVELLSDLEALGALLVAVAAEVRALDEAGGPVIPNLHVEAGI